MTNTKARNQRPLSPTIQRTEGRAEEHRRLAIGSLEQPARQSGRAGALAEELRPGDADRQLSATVAALVGIGPKDELEGMMAAQLIAAHNAAMECYRRAMIGEQTFEGRRENLNQANKLSRTYATLLEALNRHRGKGQQKVTVEHVHVHAGGQAVVGMVDEHRGVGIGAKSEEQPHAKQIAHAPEPAMRSPDTERDAVPIAGDGERPLPDARGTSPGAPIGNNNARKHGLYTAEAIAGRRDITTLIRRMKGLAEKVEEE